MIVLQFINLLSDIKFDQFSRSSEICTSHAKLYFVSVTFESFHHMCFEFIFLFGNIKEKTDEHKSETAVQTSINPILVRSLKESIIQILKDGCSHFIDIKQTQVSFMCVPSLPQGPFLLQRYEIKTVCIKGGLTTTRFGVSLLRSLIQLRNFRSSSCYPHLTAYLPS